MPQNHNGLQNGVTHALNALNRHPRRVMATLGALLLGTGVTAFGIAPLAPDAADLPVRQIVESVEPGWTYAETPEAGSLATQAVGTTGVASLLTSLPTSAGQRSPTDGIGFVLFRSDTTRRDDTVQSLLQRLGVNDPEAVAHLRADAKARQLLLGRVGKLVSVETDDQNRLLRLQARWIKDENADHFQRLVVDRQADQNPRFSSRIEKGELTQSIRLASGTIRTSLFAATDEARLPDSVANQIAEVFSADIDFRRDLRVGDRFSVVYETREADGEVLSFGRMLSGEFVNKDRPHQVVWFEEPGTKGSYYTFEGESLRRAFLAAPLAFSRVSSGYGMRFHPVHGDRRAHLGVDYAAPTGTPVRTVADGVVQFAGSQRGYGNVVFVQHRNQVVTVYAHLSSIKVRRGQRIEQGELVGAVGCTGTCTGPHLHFEFREAGVHRDPLSIARRNEGTPVSAAARPAFNQHAALMKQKLASAATVVQASAD